LKDLEKMLPSVASINGMQVKDYIQALVDDNKIRLEKIGSVNWYWSFPSDERRERENIKEKLSKDLERIARGTNGMEIEIQEKIASMKTGTDGEDDHSDVEVEAAMRETLMKRKAELGLEVQKLKIEEEALLAGGGAAMERKMKDIDTWKELTSMWTDNIYILEQYLSKLAGGDRDLVDAVKRQCYGDDYVEGEGLRELLT
jgi:hypothetical protein